ncbi:MAG: GNAT family N-acetyltransferase [Syntrophomonadaceae bacterium]|jgi:GNAT superfamily N-acetyltransferase|nr:GNAT family N-acetyltransferase [Syntrophomonadaceae bacterium]
MVSDLIASPAVVSEEQDVEEIYWHAYAAIPHYAYTKPAAVKSYLSWLKRRTKKGFMVARIAGRPVGFIAVDNNWRTPEGQGVAEIHEFVVDPAFQGRGIGKKLFQTGINFLKKRGAQNIELWVGEYNHKPHQFYRRQGFRDGGQWGKWVQMLKKV